jgi:succinate dehydrogenase / fumarate reductase, iron-sulfur subunit
MTLTHKDYLGPAILLQLDRFFQDSRDDAKAMRLDAAAGEGGVWRCHTVFNCGAVCPKELHPTEAIAHLKQALVARKLFGKGKTRRL